MVKLNEKGYTYGQSYNGMLYWKLNADGVGICFNTASIKAITINYECANNTFKEDSAILCSKKDFEAAFIIHILPSIPKELKTLINTKIKKIK